MSGLRRLLSDPRRAALLAATVGVVVFSGSLANGFAYDDARIVVADAGVHTLHGLETRLSKPYWPSASGARIGNWRPLTTALFAVEWVASGGSPLVFHLVDVMLHGIASALVVLLLAELMEAEAAALAGILFAVHPVHVEAVANVVGTAEPLSALFLLGAALVHLRARNGYGLGRALAVTLLYALAVLAKEGAVVFPLLLLLLDASRTDMDARGVGRYVREKGPLYALLAAVLGLFLIARWSVLGSTLSAPAPPGAEVLRDIPRIWTVAQVWPQYVRLLLFPRDLASDYTPGLIPIAFGWTAAGVLGVCLALTLLAGAWLAWRAGRPLAPGAGSVRVVGLSVLWAGAALLPVANVFFLSNVLLAERTLYVASVGAAAAGGWVLAGLCRQRPRAGMLAAAVVALLLAARSATRVPVWRSTETVTSTLLAEHPRAGRAWLDLAVRLADRGKTQASIRAFGVALGLLNSDTWACMQAASRILAMGHPAVARFFLRRAWQERPGWAAAPGMLAAADLELRRYHEASAAAAAATILSPANPSMDHLLAQALAGLGRYAQAVRVRAVALREGFRPGLLWILQARDLVAMGDTTAAVAALDSARAHPLTAVERAAWARTADSLAAPRGPTRRREPRSRADTLRRPGSGSPSPR